MANPAYQGERSPRSPSRAVSFQKEPCGVSCCLGGKTLQANNAVLVFLRILDDDMLMCKQPCAQLNHILRRNFHRIAIPILRVQIVCYPPVLMLTSSDTHNRHSFHSSLAATISKYPPGSSRRYTVSSSTSAAKPPVSNAVNTLPSSPGIRAILR